MAKYRVSIAAYVPANVEIKLDAKDAAEAYKKALAAYDNGDYDVEPLYEDGLRFLAAHDQILDEPPETPEGAYIAQLDANGNEI